VELGRSGGRASGVVRDVSTATLRRSSPAD
jgi:hypothetical protein